MSVHLKEMILGAIPIQIERDGEFNALALVDDIMARVENHEATLRLVVSQWVDELGLPNGSES